MSAAGAERAPVVSMRVLLAAGAAATAVSTPPSWLGRAPEEAPRAVAVPPAHGEQAAPESEAA
ncbi:hypothetical protein ACWGHM_23590 [Streptomyces sp. NPDC054904]|uniref:hypothetical protein n=1 Tax=unclassified Streptomyces TaxID=2593676 RepID=UPI0029BDF3DA|nr:hypothetical protein [Streptomyces sp. DK15]MDX2392659.1 hypothetical protein [Streptomyces sp. DK15]